MVLGDDVQDPVTVIQYFKIPAHTVLGSCSGYTWVVKKPHISQYSMWHIDFLR